MNSNEQRPKVANDDDNQFYMLQTLEEEKKKHKIYLLSLENYLKHVYYISLFHLYLLSFFTEN